MRTSCAGGVARARNAGATLLVLLVPLLLFIATLCAPRSSAQATGSGGAVTVSGFDFATYANARVISGVNDNNLNLTYTAESAVTDATVTVTVPRSQWPTRLTAIGELTWFMQAQRGMVAVRPLAGFPNKAIDPTPACSWPDQQPDVVAGGESQNIVIRHVTCAAGQQVRVLMLGIRAESAGRYRLPTLVTQSGAAPQHSSAAVRVVGPPAPVRLRISVPEFTDVGSFVTPTVFVYPDQVTVPVRITAVRADGRVADDFHDAVGLTTANGQTPCGFSPGPDSIAHQFTAADHGSAVVQLSVATLPIFGNGEQYQLRAWDISHAARHSDAQPVGLAINVPATPNGDAPPTIEGPGLITCPTSYH